MWKNRVTYITVLICAALFFVFFNGYLSLYILRLALILPAVSLVISLPCIFSTKLRLSVGQGGAQKGQELPLTVTVESRLPFLWSRLSVTLTIQNTLTGELCRERISLPFGKRAVTVTYKLTSAFCGKVECKLSRAVACDNMGLFSLPVRLGKAACCTACFYPTVYSAEMTVSRVAVPDFDSEKYSPTKSGDDPSELFDLREYRNGDRISRINWKISEKLGKTVVKEFGLPVADSIFVLFSLADTPAETDILLDTFATIFTSLKRHGEFAIGWWGGISKKFMTTAVTESVAFHQVADSVFEAGAVTEKAIDATLLPTGISRALYLCGKPESVILKTLSAKMPDARISVFKTDVNSALPSDAECICLEKGKIESILNGFAI